MSKYVHEVYTKQRDQAKLGLMTCKLIIILNFHVITIWTLAVDTARKIIFSFSRRPEKMVFPKKLRWNMIFLVLPGKMIFLFPENMILPLGEKMKDGLSQKNTWKYDIFFRCSEKMVFKIWFFLYYLERWYLFFRKHDIFSLDGKWMMIFLKKYMEIWYFLHIRVGVTNVVLCNSAKRNQIWSSHTQVKLKVIDTLDWNSK